MTEKEGTRPSWFHSLLFDNRNLASLPVDDKPNTSYVTLDTDKSPHVAACFEVIANHGIGGRPTRPSECNEHIWNQCRAHYAHALKQERGVHWRYHNGQEAKVLQHYVTRAFVYLFLC